jgi:hypothetical protein
MAIVDKDSGRTLCTTAQAAKEFGCSTHHIRGLAKEGILWQKVESPRSIFYDLDQVKRLAKERRAKRAQRKLGGRPPNGFRAA